MIGDATDVLLIVNVALTKNMIVRLRRFLEAFLLDLGFHPRFSEALLIRTEFTKKFESLQIMDVKDNC